MRESALSTTRSSSLSPYWNPCIALPLSVDIGCGSRLAPDAPRRNEARSRPWCGCPHRCRRRRPLRLEERDDREDTPMGVGGDRQTQLLEDARDVLLDAAIGEKHARSDCGVRETFRHQLEHLSLTCGQAVDRIVAASPADEL